MATERCEEVRVLAPELALDILDGQERDASLRHLAGCRECRAFVVHLSSVTDGLLLLAPEQEPPSGFADRTARLLAPPAAQPRWARIAVAAAALILAVALGAGVVLHTTSSDRVLAVAYRDVLTAGKGSFFDAEPINGPSGQVGTVWGYQGSPSWIFVTVTVPRSQAGRYGASVISMSGDRIPLDVWTLDEHGTAWGSAIPLSLGATRGIELRQIDGPGLLTATFHPVDPWE
jgi:hypothetical protein